MSELHCLIHVHCLMQFLPACSTHWIDIHSMLRSALPKGVVKNGHRVTNITQSSAEVRSSSPLSARHWGSCPR